MEGVFGDVDHEGLLGEFGHGVVVVGVAIEAFDYGVRVVFAQAYDLLRSRAVGAERCSGVGIDGRGHELKAVALADVAQ